MTKFDIQVLSLAELESHVGHIVPIDQALKARQTGETRSQHLLELKNESALSAGYHAVFK